MGDNVPMCLGVYVPTSEVLDIMVSHQRRISMNGISSILGEIKKVILKPMVRFPLYRK